MCDSCLWGCITFPSFVGQSCCNPCCNSDSESGNSETTCCACQSGCGCGCGCNGCTCQRCGGN